MERVGIGIIGCGNISEAYLKAAPTFPIIDVRGVADLRPEAAQARADAFGLKAMTVEELLADPSIEIVVNLTPPLAHVEVGLRAIDAGKHVHSEKPLGVQATGGEVAAGACGRARRARRMRAGHVPGWRSPDLSQAGRRGRDRPPRRRDRLLSLPRSRELAPESGVLLRAGRRPDAGHGSVLHHRARQSARTRRAGSGCDRALARPAYHHESAARRADDRSGSRNARRRDPAIRLRRCGYDRDELRRAPASARADRALRNRGHAPGARPESLRRRDRDRQKQDLVRAARSSTPTRTGTTAALAWRIWRMRFALGVPIARPGSWPITSSK